MKNGILIGATGLVGSHLLKLLLDDARFNAVTVFGRRPTGIHHPRLTEHLIDFSQPGDWQHLVKGDTIFLSLGTTRAKAGGKKAQFEVDHTYQYRFAAAAAKNGAETLVLVSSAGAGPKSPFFYMRMKAELERDIRKLPVERMVFIRPGSLTGPREKKRLLENFGVFVMRLANRLGILRKYRPIHAETVARAMINAALSAKPGVTTRELNEVFELAQEV